MPIQTTCPACERGYTLPDTQRGKRVRCKNCQETFVVGAAAGAVQTAAEDEVPVLREVSDEEARRIQAENRTARAAGKLPALAPAANGTGAHEDDEDRPARGVAPKKKSSMPLLLIGGGALLLFLLVCGGGGTGLAILYFSSDDSSQEANADTTPQPEVKPRFPNAFAGNNNPGKQPDNPFKAPPDNPFKAPAGGQPPVRREDPYAPPTNIDKALAMLRDEDTRRRQVAADWLNNRVVDPTRQKEVSQALEPLLDDGQTREQGGRAMGKWATLESVPALIKVLDYEGGNAWQPAIAALTRLKDARAVAALAAQLPNFFRRRDAARALQVIGPAAEKEVVKLIHHKDGGVRMEASQLLKGYNTKDDVLITQNVADLSSTEPETKRLAAEDLTKIKFDPKRRDEVGRALDPLVTDVDNRVRFAAINALSIWATKDNALSLSKALDDRGLQDRILLILIKLKPVDDQVLTAVALHLQAPDRRKFSEALVQMGAPAKVEVLAQQFLVHNDLFVRKEAALILKTVGTTANSIKLLQAVGQRDRQMTNDCVAAIATIKARMKAGGAIK
jgi:HEAT repeat protein